VFSEDHLMQARAALRQPQECRLRDGTPVVVRPIGPEDKERLQRGLRELSGRSRYHRFLASVKELSAEQLRYLTEIDCVDHMAWIALDPALPAEPGVGVGRYIRLAQEPHVAEAALTVAERYQGRGAGALLLDLLSRCAVVEGISTFRAHILQSNVAALRLVWHVGGTVTREDGNLLRLDVPVRPCPRLVGAAPP